MAMGLGLGSAGAQINWLGTTNGNMSGTGTNWSGGTVPTATDIARWNAATYTTAPTANATMTLSQLLFGSSNGGVTFGSGSSTLTLNASSGTGIQLDSGSGAVSTGSAKFALGGDQVWLNNSANAFIVAGTITNASTSINRSLTAGRQW
jgi:hypothetical protein